VDKFALTLAMPKKMIGGYLYKEIGRNNLILFGVNKLQERKEKCSFENLLNECFRLFPEAFCFSQYAGWPDARKLDRPLRELKGKNFINKDSQKFFFLTRAGRKIADDVGKKFSQRQLSI